MAELHDTGEIPTHFFMMQQGETITLRLEVVLEVHHGDDIDEVAMMAATEAQRASSQLLLGVMYAKPDEMKESSE